MVKELHNRDNFEEGVWSEELYFLAHIANLLAGVHYYTGTLLWAKGGKDAKESDRPKVPQQIRPPGWRPEKKKMSDIGMLKGMFPVMPG